VFLSDQLPPVRGRYVRHAPLALLTWFGVGGCADILFKPKDADDLADFLKQNTLPVWTLGAGSNVIIRDGGVRGVTIRLGSPFAKIKVEGSEVEVGAGCLDRTMALTCAEHGLSGLEFLISIPGTIGGALRMNAGAYGVETKDRLLWAEAITPCGELVRLTPLEMSMTYRHCAIDPTWIFTRACFVCEKKDSHVIEKRLTEILEMRQATQPVKGRTGGSTFKNPASHKAWELIDQAGCRGMRIGDAVMSEKHCNFMMNEGQASAKDLETLGEQVRTQVLTKTGISLEWEIKRLGE
jgi:UDP-N-acetylmuramate dehydrogenase